MSSEKQKGPDRRLRAAVLAPVVLICCYLNLMVYAETYKGVALVCLLGCAAILALPRFGRALAGRMSLPWLPLLAYLILCGISVLWAQSGKFFLKEYARLLIAFFVFLIPALCLPRTKSALWIFEACLAGAAAVYSAASIDLAGLRLSAWFWESISSYRGMANGFESGTRLTGIFGNGNILAGVLGIGIFLALACRQGADSRGRRLYASAVLSLCAFGFLLAFSMGASAFFALGVVVYLLAAGRHRGSLLLHMLLCALPTAAFVFLAFPFFEKTGAALAVPGLCMLADAGVCMALDELVYPRLNRCIEGRGRLTILFTAAVFLLLIAYVGLAVCITGPIVLEAGQTLRRSVYPQPGRTGLVLACDGELTVTVVSQNRREVMMHTQTELYSGPAEQAEFTVPEDSCVVYLNFRAASDAEIRSACLSTGETVALRYMLLPGFIANRLQGLLANENAIQRTVFFADGMKLFREHPLLGMGPGAFESASWGVQEFDYETKYVHNHYIQLLLDNGILGLLLFLAFVLSLARGLLCRHTGDSAPDGLRPACLALLVFILGHAAMEVTLSAGCYLPFAFGVFGLMAAFGSPFEKDRPEAAGSGTKPEKLRLPRWVQAVRFAALTLVGAYIVLLGLNMIAVKNMHGSHDNYDDFYSALEADIALDAFEHNDALLSYVINAPARGDADTLAQADEYAQRLCRVRSNAIQNYLISYYLKRGNVAGAELAAQNGADFNRASQAVWNSLFTTFYDFLLGDEAGSCSFSTDDAIQAVLNLYARMQEYNTEVLWEPIVLDENPQALVDWCLTQQ